MLPLLIFTSFFSLLLVPLHLRQTFFPLKRSPRALPLALGLTLIYWLASLLNPQSFLMTLFLFLHYLLAIGDSFYHLLSPFILKILLSFVVLTTFPLPPRRLLLAVGLYFLGYLFTHFFQFFFLGLGDLKLFFIWLLLFNYWQFYWVLLWAIATCLIYALLARLKPKEHLPFVPFLFIGLLCII